VIKVDFAPMAEVVEEERSNLGAGKDYPEGSGWGSLESTSMYKKWFHDQHAREYLFVIVHVTIA